MTWLIVQNFRMKMYYKNEFFQHCSSKIQKVVQFQLISKQETDFQVGQKLWNPWHLGRSSDDVFCIIL